MRPWQRFVRPPRAASAAAGAPTASNACVTLDQVGSIPAADFGLSSGPGSMQTRMIQLPTKNWPPKVAASDSVGSEAPVQRSIPSMKSITMK